MEESPAQDTSNQETFGCNRTFGGLGVQIFQGISSAQQFAFALSGNPSFAFLWNIVVWVAPAGESRFGFCGCGHSCLRPQKTGTEGSF